MSFSKLAGALNLALLTLTLPVMAQEVPAPKKEPTIQATKDGIRIKIPEGPQIVTIVGYTDTGVPITSRREKVANMGIALSKYMLAEEEKRVKAGGKPMKRPLTWEQRQAIIDHNRALYGEPTTQTFILPGTTPEESALIHSEKGGVKMVQTPEGVKPLYVVANDDTDKDALHIDPDAKSVEIDDTEATDAQNNAQGPTSFADAFITIKKTTRKLSPEESEREIFKARDEETGVPVYEEQRTSEELFREYFPDAQPVSLLERGLSFFVGSALASPVMTAEEVSRWRKQNEEAQKKILEDVNKRGKNAVLDDMMPDRQKEASAAMIEKAHELSSIVRQKETEALQSTLRENPLTGQPQVLPKEVEERAKAVADATTSEVLTTYVFISYSLDDEVLKNIFLANQGKDNVVYVMRGIPEGMNLGEGVKRIQTLLLDLGFTEAATQPNVMLDPLLFTHFGIKAVPTTVVARVKDFQMGKPDRTGVELIAKAEGLATDAWIKDRIAQGQSGDLGQQGTIFEIAERDLVEEIKSRVAKIDWDEKKRLALENYWANRKFTDLPTVAKYRRFEIDPSIMVTQDIKGANGEIIQAAGTQINPLAVKTFDSMVVVFNPTREDELALILKRIDGWKNEPFKKRIFIATEMDRVKGWKAFEEITEKLDAPLFFLTPEVQKRFEIVATPSFVVADNDRKVFVVEEVPAKETHDAS